MLVHFALIAVALTNFDIRNHPLRNPEEEPRDPIRPDRDDDSDELDLGVQRPPEDDDDPPMYGPNAGAFMRRLQEEPAPLAEVPLPPHYEAQIAQEERERRGDIIRGGARGQRRVRRRRLH